MLPYTTLAIGLDPRKNQSLPKWGKFASIIGVDDIEVIETEWGSELHKRLVAEEHAARVAWRNSPEAWEEARQMKEAGPLTWGRVIYPEKRKKTPIYKW